MVFSYAGISLPLPPPGGLSFELQPIDSAERNANGDMLLDEIALKVKITVKWKNLTGSQAHSVFGILRGNRTGILRYHDVSTGRVESIMAYYGAGAKINYLRYGPGLGAQLYSNITANFIEV